MKEQINVSTVTLQVCTSKVCSIQNRFLKVCSNKLTPVTPKWVNRTNAKLHKKETEWEKRGKFNLTAYLKILQVACWSVLLTQIGILERWGWSFHLLIRIIEYRGDVLSANCFVFYSSILDKNLTNKKYFLKIWHNWNI
jgi:hypothetical protein